MPSVSGVRSACLAIRTTEVREDEREQHDLAEPEDATRARRGHDPSSAALLRDERPALPGGEAIGRRDVVDGANRLRGMLEGVIVGIHLDDRQQRRDRRAERQQVAQFLFEEVVRRCSRTSVWSSARAAAAFRSPRTIDDSSGSRA